LPCEWPRRHGWDRSSVVEGIHRRLVEEGTGEEVHPSPAEAGIGLVVVAWEGEERHKGPGEEDIHLEGGSHPERTVRAVAMPVVHREEDILGKGVVEEGGLNTHEEGHRDRLGEGDIRQEGVVGSTTWAAEWIRSLCKLREERERRQFKASNDVRARLEIRCHLAREMLYTLIKGGGVPSKDLDNSY